MTDLQSNDITPVIHDFSWATTNDHGSEQIRFLAAVEPTSQPMASLSEATMRRLVSIYIVCHLSSNNLVEIYDTLVDTYAWQIKQASIISADRLSERIISAPEIEKVERVPFAYREG